MAVEKSKVIEDSLAVLWVGDEVVNEEVLLGALVHQGVVLPAHHLYTRQHCWLHPQSIIIHTSPGSKPFLTSL